MSAADNSGIEKRTLKRRQLVYYLKVTDRNTDETIGRLVDITTGGVMLISPQPVETNRIFEMSMELPEEMEGLEREVHFNAKSRWTKKDLNPDFYVTGFQFEDVSPDDIISIGDLIRQYELPGGLSDR